MIRHLRLFLCIIFFLDLLSLSLSSSPPFPCKHPNHNSYPFCNISLPISTRVRSLISFLTLPEKIQQLSNNASAIPRLGIPSYEWWSESLHGISANGPGVTFNGTIRSVTIFPQVIVSAASFNRSLWKSIASAVSVEARAMYNVGQAGLTFWAPNINIFRDPRWGRGQETPGEDPFVVSEYAVEYVKGFQGDGLKGCGETCGGFIDQQQVLESDDGTDPLMLSACCKHFTAYDLDKWGNFARYNFNAVVTEQDMEDTYQPPFQNCIQKGKSSCLMCSYNQVNGIPACAHHDLLQKARDDWGFKGYVTSDCDAVATIYEYQNYTQSPEDAVSIAIKAGTDINCGTYMLRHTQSALEQGKVQEVDIDKALYNLFSVQLRLGLFDGDPSKGNFGHLGPHSVCSLEHKKLALDAARQGIVLLKNDKKFLPLNKNGISSLAVIGPMGNATSQLGGDYTGIPCEPTSFLRGLKKYVNKVTYVAGCENVSCENNTGFSEAVKVSKNADVVIVVVGLDLSQETEELDRYSLLLPGYQMSLISAIAGNTGKPLILVVTGGGPLDISFAKVNKQIASILWVGYPGEAGGEALAEIIFGDYNPGGRLPMTWYPEAFTKVPMTDMNMRANPSRDYPGRSYRFYTGDKVYGFGDGLSYSDFTYKLLKAPSKLLLSGSLLTEPKRNILRQTKDALDYVYIDELDSCDLLRFTVDITVMNNGNMDGSHVVLLFSRAPKIFDGAPVKQLIGFNRILTFSSRCTETSISVDSCEHLSIVNQQGRRILPLGDHILILDGLEHVIAVEF